MAPANRLTFKALGIFGWMAVVVLSIVPAAARPHSGAGGIYEHFIAYALVSACLSLGYSGKVGWKVLAALTMSAGALEVIQLQIPGRTSELEGFVSGGLGVACGWALAVIGNRILRKKELYR